MLALGAVPAAAVIYLRRRMPESPRYQVQVQSKTAQAARQVSGFTGGRVSATGAALRHQIGLRAFLTDRRYLIMLAGTAGTWFLLDYAYYGNTVSTPQILGLISPGASAMTKIAIQLAIFVVAAVPGLRAGDRLARPDRAPPVQLPGFALMAFCFLIIAAVPGMTITVAPFLLVYGVSYFFTEFCPNMTTFVMPSELYPVSMRATGHGISAGGRQAWRLHRRLRVPAAAGLPGPARHPAAHRGGVGGRAGAHPGAARAGRAQPGRHSPRRV
jgi:PHS family inorganic phosphate transporter-like MFS transporter